MCGSCDEFPKSPCPLGRSDVVRRRWRAWRGMSVRLGWVVSCCFLLKPAALAGFGDFHAVHRAIGERVFNEARRAGHAHFGSALPNGDELPSKARNDLALRSGGNCMAGDEQ